jgi:hypothetical protein
VADSVPAPLEMHDLAIRLERGTTDLADVARVLAGAGINIDAVACQSFTAPTMCHLLVGDGIGAMRALDGAGLNSTTCMPVLVYTLPNRPGTLARYTDALLTNGVAIDFLYQSTGRGVVVGAPDLDAVRSAFVAASQSAP